MQNKIWEQVGQFLNRLRCENAARDTAVEVPGYKESQEEMERLREKCEAAMQIILVLDCPWEEEHGWAAVFIDEKFVKVGCDIVDCVWLD